MFWFLVCTLLFHYSVAMEGDTKSVKDIFKTMSEIIPSSDDYKARKVLCPGGEYYCPDGNTCCMLKSGQWACCPLPKAVCCPDHLHCCPNGYKCTPGAKCLRGSHVTKQFKKTPAIQARKVVCPGEKYSCPDGNTCCMLESGQWACCPLPKAVCCPDHLHCCPNGYKCTPGAKCLRGSHVTKQFKKTPAIQARKVVCPGGQYYCPDGNTCCRLESGQWGCCPFPEAVCCPDLIHCCPNGYKCTSGGSCQRGSHVIKLFKKTSAIQAKNVVCPGGQVECPDGNTCCALASGEWGCCPLPNAVCCSDHVHCCPEGYTCDVSEGTCSLQSDITHISANKLSIGVPKSKNVVCPDKSECPDGATCCKRKSGEYGCCPLPNAVCCSDGEHCCPEGYTCDVAQQKCLQRGHVNKDIFMNKPATKVEKVSKAVMTK